MMTVRRVNLAYVPLKIDVLPANIQTNAVYRAACIGVLQPSALASAVGRLSEESSRLLLARVYAEAVIVGSPTPGYEKFTRDDWCRWLMENPEAFDDLRAVCENPSNFEEPHGVPGPGIAGS